MGTSMSDPCRISLQSKSVPPFWPSTLDPRRSTPHVTFPPFHLPTFYQNRFAVALVPNRFPIHETLPSHLTDYKTSPIL
jgi:hypothetical protein